MMYMYLGCAVLLCLVCLFAFACFFLSSFSHLSLKHVYTCMSSFLYLLHSFSGSSILIFSFGRSKVIRGIIARKEGEPGTKANINYFYVIVTIVSSAGRALCLECRVSWVQVPPEVAH